MIQNEVMFWMPDGRPLYPQEGRRLLGELCGDKLDPAFFHHQEEDRLLPKSGGVPPVRFSGNGKIFRIIGVGVVGAELVNESFATVLAALTKRFGPLKTQMAESEHALTFSAMPRRYAIRHMFLYKGIDERDKFAALDAVAKRAWLLDMVCRGLARQYEELGYDGKMPDLRPQLNAFVEHSVHPIKDGSKIHGGVADLVVTLQAKLVGHWAAGLLISKGYGRLDPYLESTDPQEFLMSRFAAKMASR
ncbi:MAG TPA: hypothetical protein VHE37_10485 [Nevskiaceae bacterium]|nr:hypothetical protein [Nevskiaceae bacterium]